MDQDGQNTDLHAAMRPKELETDGGAGMFNAVVLPSLSLPCKN